MRVLALLVAGGLSLLVGALAAAWVHYGYAAQNHRAAKAAVPIARRIRIARGLDLLRWVALVAIACGLLYLLATGPQR